MEKEHHVPQDKELQVHAGDYVEAGDPLIRGPIIPHDILRIKGEEALYQYLLTEVQNVYRSQGVKINDKHIEIILEPDAAQGEGRRRGRHQVPAGRSGRQVPLPPGQRRRSATSVTRRRAGRHGLQGRRRRRQGRATRRPTRPPRPPARTRPRARSPRPARGKTLLLGITKASLQSESFISAASFQETTKVLTEAALAGAVDTLVGLKENVILGHLIPAGTAFNPHLNLKIKHLAEPMAEEDNEPVARAPRASADGRSCCGNSPAGW